MSSVVSGKAFAQTATVTCKLPYVTNGNLSEEEVSLWNESICKRNQKKNTPKNKLGKSCRFDKLDDYPAESKIEADLVKKVLTLEPYKSHLSHMDLVIACVAIIGDIEFKRDQIQTGLIFDSVVFDGNFFNHKFQIGTRFGL